MTRRGQALLGVLLLLGVLVAVAAAVPVPYLTLGPGPVCNTVGRPTAECQSRFAGTLIRIRPASFTHPKRGDVLALTTVSETDSISLLQAIKSYFTASQAVIPREVLFPPGESSAQVSKADTAEMVQSQSSAAVAALTHLGLVRVEVTKVITGAPAAGRLRAGDVITAVDGRPVGNADVLVERLGSVKPGQTVALRVLRAGRSRTVRVVTGRNPQQHSRAFLGVELVDRFAHGLSVHVGLKGIGGPSAGLMLTLGILDEFSRSSLTGGRVIAGTGTINDLGQVGPIGGIQQKMYAARHDEHATVFLAPAGDCGEAAAAIPNGLQVVKVTSLDGALQALADLRAGKTDLPGC